LIANVSNAWTELGDAGQVVAGAAALLVLITLALAWKQIRMQVRINRFAVYDGLTRLVMDTDRVFIEHPEMRKYFYDGYPPPTDPLELARALAIAELLADFMDHVAEHIDELEDSAWEEWKAYFGEFRQSQVFKSFMDQNPTWYSPRLRTALRPPIPKPAPEYEPGRYPDEAVITRWRRERREKRAALREG
jgi:hypothetical protein